MFSKSLWQDCDFPFTHPCMYTDLGYLCPLSKKEEHIALHMSVGRYVGRSVCMSVGMSVSLNLVQLITQERFATEASNLVGR